MKHLLIEVRDDCNLDTIEYQATPDYSWHRANAKEAVEIQGGIITYANNDHGLLGKPVTLYAVAKQSDSKKKGG